MLATVLSWMCVVRTHSFSGTHTDVRVCIQGALIVCTRGPPIVHTRGPLIQTMMTKHLNMLCYEYSKAVSISGKHPSHLPSPDQWQARNHTAVTCHSQWKRRTKSIRTNLYNKGQFGSHNEWMNERMNERMNECNDTLWLLNLDQRN